MIAQYLVSGGQIEPVASGMRIELHGGAVGLDGGAGISGDQRVIASQMIAVVGVAGVETRGALQAGEFGSFSETEMRQTVVPPGRHRLGTERRASANERVFSAPAELRSDFHVAQESFGYLSRAAPVVMSYDRMLHNDSLRRFGRGL